MSELTPDQFFAEATVGDSVTVRRGDQAGPTGTVCEIWPGRRHVFLAQPSGQRIGLSLGTEEMQHSSFTVTSRAGAAS